MAYPGERAGGAFRLLDYLSQVGSRSDRADGLGSNPASVTGLASGDIHFDQHFFAIKAKSDNSNCSVSVKHTIADAELVAIGFDLSGHAHSFPHRGTELLVVYHVLVFWEDCAEIRTFCV